MGSPRRCLRAKPRGSARSTRGASSSLRSGSMAASHESTKGRQPSSDASTYTMPARETVAGEATDRSSTSKRRETCAGIAMRSPLMSVRSLLSSRTVFIDSIHSVSTGPSISSHFSSGLSSEHTSRITFARTPSVHSKVCRSYSPYRLAYGTALGLMTIGRTAWKPSTSAFRSRDIAAASTFQTVDLPPSDGPTSMLPWRVSLDS
mmetsp:Transcript_13821/g.40581  ORF Transcript_13821/g.40581 Transcript_13821/m.40581 type:complete len:205 (+) Transcript_13821:6572-7186(+)